MLRCAYYHEWPVLVVSPSSARFHWEAEFLQWLPDEGYLPRDGVLVITSERTATTAAVDRAKILVTSYDLVHREAVKKTLTRVAPNVIICDECYPGSIYTNGLLDSLRLWIKYALLGATT